MAKRTRRPNRGLIALVLVAAICFAPGAILRWQIGRSVAAKMQWVLGPAKSYSVGVSASLLDIVRGHISTLDIRGNDVKLSTGVTVDRLDIDLKDVRFDRNQAITGVKSTDFAASVSEHNLTDFLTASRSDMRGAKVTLADGKLTLSASPRVFATRTPVTLEAGLRIVNHTKLWLDLRKLRARGMRVPGFVRGRIMHGLNPVLDTDQMGVPAELTSVKIDGGEISLTGKADVQKALAGK